MPAPIRILHLEDNSHDAEIIQHKLAAGGLACDIVGVDNQAQFTAALAGTAFDVILCDYNLPNYDGLSALQLVREQHPETPVILISGSLGEEEAVKCLQAGATDYLLKQRLEHLPSAVKRALKEASELRRLRQAEETLARERTLLLALIDNLPGYIYLKDAQGRYLLANLPTVRFFGMSSVADVLGKTVFELFPPEIAEPFAADDRTVVTTGKPILGREERFENGDQRGWFSTTKVPLRDASGKITGLVGITLDITERKRAEDKLAASEWRLRAIIDSEPECVKLLAADGSLLEMNPSGLRMIEADSLEQVKNQCVYPLVIAEHRAAFRELVAQAFRGEPGTLEFQIIGLKGSRRWLEIHSTPMRDAEGRVTALLGVTRDTTERKLVSEVLDRERALLRTLVDLLPDHIYVKDTQSRFLLANDAVAHAMGVVTPEELIGKSDQDFYPPESSTIFRSDEQEVLVGHSMFNKEEPVIHPDGTQRFILATKVPLTDAAGNITGLVGIGRDFTARKQVEVALQASEQRLNFALQTSHTGAWELNLQDHTAYRTALHDEIFGYQAPLPGWTYEVFLDHVLSEDRAAVDQSFRAATAAHSDWNFECRIRRVDGAVRWIWASGGHERDEAGQPARMSGIVQDITKRKQAEETTAMMRFSVDRAGDSIFWLSRDGHILYANDAACASRGYSREELLGMKIFDLDPDYQPGVWGLHFEDLTRRGTITLETRHRRKNGEVYPIEVNANYVFIHGQEFNFCFLRDITERKRAEQLLAWEKSALELIASPATLSEVLHGLMLGLEQQLPGALCSVLLLDADGIHLRHGAGPSLPPAYNRLIDGVVIGPSVGSCGTATYTNRQVIVTDIGSDPLWADYRELALGHGLRACWSTPIHDSRGKILGTFANYHRAPCSPAPTALELIERAKHIVGIAIERKQAEEQLRQSETRLANAQRMAKLGHWELDLGNLADADRNRLHWSDEVFRIFGYQPGEIEVSNEDFFRAVHPEDRPRIQTAMAQSVRERQPYNLIHRIVLPDGTQRIVQEQSEIQFEDQSGQPLKMVGTVQDITDLKKTEQALADSEALYESLVEHLPLSVFRKDREGRFTFANARFCAAIGKPLTDVLGQADSDIAPADLAQKYRTDDRQVMETGESLELVEENRSAGGKTRFMQVVKAPLRNTDGAIVGVQGIFMDVTERRELEEQLRQSQKMDAIGQLAGGVAHDFNNLLTIIQGYSQLLLTHGGLPEGAAEQIRQIYSAGEKAADLTRQLLTFGRKQAMIPRALDLNESVRNVTKMLQRIIGEDVTLHCAFAPALPLVLADAGMMDQILLNLSVNARDAMSKGGRLTIETAVVELNTEQAQQNPNAHAGRFVCLSVQDTGSGIAPEHLAHIFEPFFTTKEIGKGTGLGLATVFGIVQQHHGWMEVESTVGAGTSFKVFLPVTANAPTPVTESSRKIRGGTETILVVEDEESLRNIVLIVLRKQGYRVLEAASGVKALVVWEQHATEIDLLLTDLVMPDGVTGRELAEQLRAKRPGLKVIYTSGYSPEFAGPDLALREGLNFLQKPYRPQKLAQTVRDCLDE